jgi:hypothetical protein
MANGSDMKIFRFRDFSVCLDGDLDRLPERPTGVEPWTGPLPPRFDASLHVRTGPVPEIPGEAVEAWISALARRGGWPEPSLTRVHPHLRLTWGRLATAEWRPGRGWVMLTLAESVPPQVWPCVVAPLLALALQASGLRVADGDSFMDWPFGFPPESDA